MSDPYLVLGVADDADDAGIHAAYLTGIKRWPPDRDPARFEALRAAYESVRTRRDRLAQALFDATPPTVGDILDKAAPVGEPRRPGAALFAALLKGGA
ncbi:MAG: molecular chaperone DnaJ [Chromatiaceae bacterium]|jgi:curved DNA-binding protein CbpA|nr:molecular chaperone DnaJ [Chromatiaceae bacterium]